VVCRSITFDTADESPWNRFIPDPEIDPVTGRADLWLKVKPMTA